jgi:CubicO group peptidase (beta-lactamase class C family)
MRKLLILLLLPITLQAQKNYSTKIESYMQAEVSVNKFNGNVLIAKHGNIIYQKAFGYRNYNTKELLDNNSVFELASVSKQFTAMGIMLLKEKSLLKLSDSLRKFIPELPYYNITIRHLLNHTSGLPEYGDAMARKWDHKKVAFNRDAIEFLSKEKIPVNFKPGEKWEYSNTAYDLLASIIERVSGLSFSDYMQENIFKPLGMQYSIVYNTRRSTNKIIPDYAYGYVYSDSLKRFILPDSLPEYDYVIWVDGIVGSGVINSTLGDLLKWDRALKNHLLLNPTSNAEMLSHQSLIDTISMLHYGYGVILGTNEFGDYIMHTGSWPGYKIILFRYLNDDITIIVLSNNESNPLYIEGMLAYIMYDRQVVLPYIHKTVPIDTLVLDKFVGKYRIDNIPTTSTLSSIPVPAIIVISKKDRKLLFCFENKKEAVELKPESKYKYFTETKPDIQVEFEVNQRGDVMKAFYIVHGMKNEMKKLN